MANFLDFSVIKDARTEDGIIFITLTHKDSEIDFSFFLVNKAEETEFLNKEEIIRIFNTKIDEFKEKGKIFNHELILGEIYRDISKLIKSYL